MESREKLEKYVKQPKWLMLLGWVLLAAAAVLVVVGMVAAGNQDQAEAVAFDPAGSERGGYAYVDVVGVSEWVCKNGDEVYYAALDARGNLCSLRLSDHQYNSMKAQQEYWANESEDAVVPSPKRIYGRVESLNRDVLKLMTEAWGFTEAEVKGYFGSLVFNGTTTPGENTVAMYAVLAMFSALFGLLFLIMYAGPGSLAKKCLGALEDRGALDRAAEQLGAESNLVLGKDRGQLSEDYIYGRKTGAVVPYSDILWCYRRTVRQYFVTTDSLILCTRARKEIQAVNMGVDKHGELDEAFALIMKKNPQALVGFTAENRKAYKERKKLG